MVQTIDLEQLKTFSVLSDTPQFFDGGPGSKFVTYLGYTFTFSTFTTLLMWAMCDQPIYYHIWSEQTESVRLLKKLNSHDQKLQDMNIDYVGYYFLDKLKEALALQSERTIESIVEHMIENGMVSAENTM